MTAKIRETEFKASRLKAFESVLSLVDKFNLKPTPLKSRDIALEELEFTIADVEIYVQAIRPASCPSKYKKNLKKLLNLLSSSLTSIQNRRAKLSEIKSLMLGDVCSILSVLTEQLKEFEAESGEKTPEKIALEDTKHISKLKSTLYAYKKKFEHKLPYKLTNPGGAQILALPLSVNLDKPIKHGLLEEIGLPVKTLSSNGYGSDLGYIFESQTILAFSRQGAEDLAQSDYEYDLANSSEAKHKAYLDEYRKELRAAKRELSKFNATHEGKRLSAKMRKSVNADRVELEGFVSVLETKVADMQVKTKSNFVQRKAGRDVKKFNQVYIDTAVKILAKLSENSGRKLTLISNSFLINPRNPDILLFWFMPTEQYTIVNTLSSFNFSVTNWDFAWSRSITGDQELQSVGLPTKLNNRG